MEILEKQRVEDLKNPRSVFLPTISGLRHANGVVNGVKLKFLDKDDRKANDLSVDRILEILPNAARLTRLDVFLIATPDGLLDAGQVSTYMSKLRLRKDILDTLLSVEGKKKAMPSNMLETRFSRYQQPVMEEAEQMKSLNLLKISPSGIMKRMDIVTVNNAELCKLVVRDWESKLATLAEVRKGMTPTADASRTTARDDVPRLLLKARIAISEQTGVTIERLEVISFARDEPIEATIGDRETDRLYLVQVYSSGRVDGIRQIK